MTQVKTNPAVEVKPSIETKYFYVVLGFFFKDGSVGEAEARAVKYESIVKRAKAKLDRKGWSLIDRFNMHRSPEAVLTYSIKILSEGRSFYKVFETDLDGKAKFIEECYALNLSDDCELSINWYEEFGEDRNEPIAA